MENFDSIRNIITAMKQAQSPPSPNASSFMQTILTNRSLSDIELLVSNDGDETPNRIQTHSLVLRTKSPVFNSMLESGRFQEGSSKTVMVEGFKFENVHRFIEFLYVEKLPRIRWNDALELLRIAHYYQVDELIGILVIRLSTRLDLENSLEILELADHLSLESLSRSALRVLARGAFIFFDQMLHVEASPRAMTMILEMESLNVENEFQVVEALWYWGEWHCRRQNKELSTENIMAAMESSMLSNVRWDELPQCQLGPNCPMNSMISLRSSFLAARSPNVHKGNVANSSGQNASSSSVCLSRKRVPSHSPSLKDHCQILSIVDISVLTTLDLWFPNGRNECITFSLSRDIYLVAIEFFVMIEQGIFPSVKDHLKLKIFSAQDSSMDTLTELPIDYHYSCEKLSGHSNGPVWYWASAITAELTNALRLKQDMVFTIKLHKTCAPEKVIYHKHVRKQYLLTDVDIKLLTHSLEVYAVQRLFYIPCRD